jgi:hypothetical protein
VLGSRTRAVANALGEYGVSGVDGAVLSSVPLRAELPPSPPPAPTHTLRSAVQRFAKARRSQGEEGPGGLAHTRLQLGLRAGVVGVGDQAPTQRRSVRLIISHCIESNRTSRAAVRGEHLRRRRRARKRESTSRAPPHRLAPWPPPPPLSLSLSLVLSLVLRPSSVLRRASALRYGRRPSCRRPRRSPATMPRAALSDTPRHEGVTSS